jgi:hypothetical protein
MHARMFPSMKRGHRHEGRFPELLASPGGVGSSKSMLFQRLDNVSGACNAFRETRSRDAVYSYLRAVFWIVKYYSKRDRTKRLIRAAYRFAGLPFDLNAEPFATVMRCTCKGKIDNKTISKWSRALRYAARFKKRTPLGTFIKSQGGINACAAFFTKRLGRHRLLSRQK